VPLHQVPVPAQQRLRLNENLVATRSRDEPGQTREDGPIRRLEGGSGDLAAQDHHLVAQHDDFDSQLSAIPAEPAKDLKDATEGSVEKGEVHGRGILVLPPASTKVLVLRSDDFLAPTRWKLGRTPRALSRRLGEVPADGAPYHRFRYGW
jgi:hypothetical protein